MKRNLYLKTISVEDASKIYFDALVSAGVLVKKIEEVDVYDALGRITSEPIYAKCNSPLYNLSSMDGICVKSNELKNISEENPKVIELGKDYKIVDTGDPIYDPYDAVIMAEDIIEVDDMHCKIISSPTTMQNVRSIGEDIVQNEMLLPTNHKITATDIGALLASGNIKIKCYKNINVGVIPTGDEIIKPTDKPKIGDIIDSNSGMLASLVERDGGIKKRYDIVKDKYDDIKNAILKATKENDVVLINAGSSAGTEDYTVHVLNEIGKVYVHGVSIKPGKPVILAIVDKVPVIGCPGYPVSSYLAYENFIKPILDILQGKSKEYKSIFSDKNNVLKCVASKRIVSSLKYEEYVRVKVGKVDDKYIASPLSRNASSQMSMVRADGFLIIPKNSEGIEASEECEVKLFKDKNIIDNTLVSIGSHDILMDIISDILPSKHNTYLSSAHVGSMAGLMALKRNETMIAPTHLLDEKDGIYNVNILREIFGEGKVSLIKGFDRIQGIMVKKGNPLNIKTIKDIVGKKFVNRQKGAGTRVLLDYLIKNENINVEDIAGYDKEVPTHMMVAASVANGESDCGLGIKSVATAMNLDFIEVGVEEYDFAIYTENLDNVMVKDFIDVLCSAELKSKLDAIGGYGYRNVGKITNI